RVSSIPSTAVGAGSGSHRAAAAINARCAVCQAMRYSPATSATARFDAAIAEATLDRSRFVSRDRGGICSIASVNEPLPHCGFAQTRRRLRHHRSTRLPPAGRSLIRTSGRCLTRLLTCPQPGQAPCWSMVSTTTRTRSSSTRSTSMTRNPSRPNRTEVASCMLVASPPSCGGRQTACRGHEPHSGSDTPLKCEGPLNWLAEKRGPCTVFEASQALKVNQDWLGDTGVLSQVFELSLHLERA